MHERESLNRPRVHDSDEQLFDEEIGKERKIVAVNVWRIFQDICRTEVVGF